MTNTNRFRISYVWQLFLLGAGAMLVSSQADAQFSFYAVAPCRVVDTRSANSTNGGPALGPNTQRNFSIQGRCGVPAGAPAVSINVTVTGATSSSFLTVWPSAQARPNVSTINFTPNDQALANGAIVGLSNGTTNLAVYNSSGSVHVIIDVTGFFQ